MPTKQISDHKVILYKKNNVFDMIYYYYRKKTATYLILGTYSNKRAKGLVKKDSNRREAMKTFADSVGKNL